MSSDVNVNENEIEGFFLCLNSFELPSTPLIRVILYVYVVGGVK